MISSKFSSLIAREHWSLSSVKSDAIAGVTGAILVIPQGIAYAMIAGLPPEFGLYTAIFSAVIASLFGSSKHMVSGPTAALSIVSAVVVGGLVGVSESSYLSLMFLLSFLTGCFQLLFYLLRFGFLVNFISHSVVQGFTSGAAVLIAMSQLSNFLGLSNNQGTSFIDYASAVIFRTERIDQASVWIGVITVVSAVVIKSWFKAIPYLLASIVIGAVSCYLLFANNASVSLISALPDVIPVFKVPDFSLASIMALSSGALSIAILGAIEAVSIARSIAIRSKQSIDGNREFLGQGLSNVVGSFFQCYPSSGSFTRSGGNYDSGAKTSLAIVISAFLVLLVILFIPRATQFIPVPVMAGSILVIAWNLFNWQGVKANLSSPKAESVPFLFTFFGTLLVPLEYAIYLGIAASLVFYLAKTARPKVTVVAPLALDGHPRQIRNVERYQLPECPEIKMARLDGSVFYGASESLKASIRELLSSGHKRLILIFKGVNFIDVSGQHSLVDEVDRIHQQGGTIFFSSLKGIVQDELTDEQLIERLKDGVLKPSMQTAIANMVEQIPRSVCAECTKKVFQECPK
ncbi:SulP family sulfate permease [Marinomonas alcarazii]|uniref:SulP family sulfate permease n=1 Tax=Marinomonas alcarazii TaxID=491949 RepID=A0A318V3A5_9GAMM|nr:SulP family inorganic anion transporter [Marinomonas alcarazii]PYF82463.1 SulP family sulfate permease [Marinomonas alcarazii]